MLNHSVVSDSLRLQGLWSASLLCPWDSPGKNTRVGCHFLLQRMEMKSESEVAQSSPTLSDPMDCSPPGSPVPETYLQVSCQARWLQAPGGSESACNSREQSSIPGLGRSPGEGNGNPFQSSCLENSTDRGV